MTEWCRGIGIANTLAWTPNRKRFYFGDTLRNVIWLYDYDTANGSISNQRPFLRDFSRGLPDGSCVDAEGYLWNCRYYGGCVVRVTPSGDVDCVVEMPVQNITTCAFGSADGKTLYVTTARSEKSPHNRLAGGLFAMRTDVAGQAENRFGVSGTSGRR